MPHEGPPLHHPLPHMVRVFVRPNQFRPTVQLSVTVPTPRAHITVIHIRFASDKAEARTGDDMALEAIKDQRKLMALNLAGQIVPHILPSFLRVFVRLR